MTNDIATIAGRWKLVEWAYCWCIELPESDEADTQADGYHFLYDKNLTQPGAPEAVGGSVFIVTADHCFHQQSKGQPPLASYDRDGIQIEGIDAFSGHIHPADGVFYLLADGVAEYDKPAMPQHRQRLRLDSGNTQICDYLERDGDILVRKMQVTTDWTYGDCVVLRYQRDTVAEQS